MDRSIGKVEGLYYYFLYTNIIFLEQDFLLCFVDIIKVLDALKELNLEEDTLVVFTSDNGPEHQTAAGTPGEPFTTQFIFSLNYNCLCDN